MVLLTEVLCCLFLDSATGESTGYTLHETKVETNGAINGVLASSRVIVDGLEVDTTTGSFYALNTRFGDRGLIKRVKVNGNGTGGGVSGGNQAWNMEWEDVIVTNVNGTCFLNQGWNGSFKNILVSNCSADGILLYGTGIKAYNLTAMNIVGDGVMVEDSAFIASGITTINNTANGFEAYSLFGFPTALYANIFSSNNQRGFHVNQHTFIFENLIATDNDVGVNLVSGTHDNDFSGILGLGGNTTNCSYTSPGTDPGFSGADCDNQGASSTTRTLALDTSSYFVGSVTSESTNTHSTGSVAYGSLTDFLNFDNNYRAWGKDGTYPNSAIRGACSGADTCRIWDWSLDSGAALALNANGIFLPGAACPSSVQGDNTFTLGGEDFLKNAYEIAGDALGDDDLLCETGEACIFQPNIGGYQGHGPLFSSPCIFDDGVTASGVTGVLLL
ncbi:MAG: hypothetical protein R2827_05100 [Bdellovibrionales bacterium]